MKVQVKRAFKSYSFLSPRKIIQKQIPCMKFSSTSNTSVKLVSQFPISKSAPPVLLKPWVRIKKNGKPIVLIITLVLQDYPLGYILWYFYKPLRVLSLQNFFFFFFFIFSQTSSHHFSYPTMVGGNFQIYGVLMTGKMHLQVKKLNWI